MMQIIVLAIAAKADPTYSCPAPDLKGLATHGLDAVPDHGGVTTVYVINHGGRDAVEVFKLRAATAAAEWVGCVVVPTRPGGPGQWRGVPVDCGERLQRSTGHAAFGRQRHRGLARWPMGVRLTPVVKEPGYPEFDNATSTVQVGQTLWFGTFQGDRMAYRPAP